MRYNFALPIILSAFLAGCAGYPPVIKSESIESRTPTASLILPKNAQTDSSEKKNELSVAQRIIFEERRTVGDSAYSEANSLEWKLIGDNGFSVERFKALYSTNTQRDLAKVSVTYEGNIQTTIDKSVEKLDFIITQRNYVAVPHAFDGSIAYDVSFTPTDVLNSLARSKISWTTDVDSAFSPEATYANFVRLTRAIAMSGKADPVTGKIFKERFWISLGDTEVPVFIETYPYRNGSKVVVYAQLPGKLSGNTIDFSTLAAALKKEIDRIIKS